MELKDLTLLREADFKLLNRCLEVYPTIGDIADIMGDALLGTMRPTGQVNRDAQIREQELKRNLSREALQEDCRELQGRLIQLKRLLAGEGALKGAEEILKGGTK